MRDDYHKKKLILNLTGEKARDYSYLIAFFLIFSFFIFFVIQPNLKSIFEANLTIEKLKKDNTLYEYEITNVIDIQDKLIEFRNDLPIINQALTSKPEVNQLINDINKTVKNNHFTIDNFSLTDLNLKDVSKENLLKSVLFSLDISGNFPNFVSLLNDIYQQRRLKFIKSVSISKDSRQEKLEVATESANFSTGSANLKINLIVEGYYL